MVLSILADKHLEKNVPIDLINVAYFSHNKDETPPDRVTAIGGVEELMKISSHRQWRLVLVDINYDLLKDAEGEIISLINPCNTVMDFNIGSILHFASLGRGILYSNKMPYTTSARIFLSGLGADELFAGYARHRTIFKSKGNLGVSFELFREINRLYRRNLGRDDRIVSNNAKEMRYPYLDEAVIDTTFQLLSSPSAFNFIFDLSLPIGIGDKMILRQIAKKLGLPAPISTLPKRAMQFGTRIANNRIAGYVILDQKTNVNGLSIVDIIRSEKQLIPDIYNKKENKKRGKPNYL